jgi:hypothetical protein
MKSSPSKTISSSFALVAISMALATAFSARAQGNDHRAPDVPGAIRAPAGNKVHFHVYAEGVQIYSWWESASGSKVVGARDASAPSPNANSIPMLLLHAVTAEGPGILARTTYIQRVNTLGGVAPSSPGASVGEQARVPYTAEYFFYRGTH